MRMFRQSSSVASPGTRSILAYLPPPNRTSQIIATIANRKSAMKNITMHLSLLGAYVSLIATPALAQNSPIELHVDAIDASRNILHARMQFPAQPGRLTLAYPKWLQGEHAPTGPITDLVGLKMHAAGRSVS